MTCPRAHLPPGAVASAPSLPDLLRSCTDHPLWICCFGVAGPAVCAQWCPAFPRGAWALQLLRLGDPPHARSLPAASASSAALDPIPGPAESPGQAPLQPRRPPAMGRGPPGPEVAASSCPPGKDGCPSGFWAQPRRGGVQISPLHPRPQCPSSPDRRGRAAPAFTSTRQPRMLRPPPPPLRARVHPRSAPLTQLPMALPQLPGVKVAVGVPEVVGHGHVLQAVVRRRRGLGQPVAGAAALGGAQGARPFAEVVRVQRVTV